MQQDQIIKQFLAVRAFIIHEGKVLIIRESVAYANKKGNHDQKYDFPGGKIKPGEKYQDATIREVKEECGLDIVVDKPFFLDEWRPIIKGEQIQILGVYLLCHAKNITITLSADHDIYEWIDPKDYKQYQHLTPNNKAFIAYLKN